MVDSSFTRFGHFETAGGDSQHGVTSSDHKVENVIEHMDSSSPFTNWIDVVPW